MTVAILQVSETEYVSISDPAGGIVVTVDGSEPEIVVSEGVQGPRGIQGIQGPAGSIDATYRASIDMSGHRMVTLTGPDLIGYASNDSASSANRTIGMTVNAAIAGASVVVQSFGEIAEPSWNWDTNLPVYLGTEGHLTQVQPTSPQAIFSTIVGFPTSATTLHLSIGASITLST